MILPLQTTPTRTSSPHTCCVRCDASSKTIRFWRKSRSSLKICSAPQTPSTSFATRWSCTENYAAASCRSPEEPMQNPDSIFQRAISKLLTEIFEGPPGDEAYVLNPGDPGLLRQLESISASTASARPIPGKSSIAAHADHVHY